MSRTEHLEAERVAVEENVADADAWARLRPQDYAATPSTSPEGFGAPLTAPVGPTVAEVDGVLRLDWPAGRPRWFVITPEALEELIDRVNDLAEDVRLLEAAAVDQGDDGPDAGDGRDPWQEFTPHAPWCLTVTLEGGTSCTCAPEES